MKLEKISQIVMGVLATLTVVSFLLFFTVGYDNFDGKNNAPQLTGFLLWVQYLLAIGGFLLMMWSVFVSARKNSGVDEKETTGIPGKKITLFTVLVTIASLAVGLVLGLGEEDFTTTSGVFTPGYMVTLVDVCMWSIYILSIVSVAAVVVSATGVLRKSNQAQ